MLVLFLGHLQQKYDANVPLPDSNTDGFSKFLKLPCTEIYSPYTKVGRLLLNEICKNTWHV